MKLFIAALSIASLLGASAADYHVTPKGTPHGRGDLDTPWDLQTALNQPAAVAPGDTIWLHAGTYAGKFVSVLAGNSNAFITVRGRAGDRVTLDGPESDSKVHPLTIEGSWTIYRDFEVIHSATWRPDALTPAAVQCAAPNIKLINLVVHDAGQGIGCWMGATNAEIYGCILYHNGSRPLEHGIYTQNDVVTGTKRIHDNIIFNNSGFGVHAYTQAGQLSGFDFSGNILFNNGSKPGDDTRYDNLLVGGTPPSDQITVTSNYTFFTPGVSRPNVRLSYGDHQANPHGRLVVSGNYIVGGTCFTADDWREITFTNNVLVNWAAQLAHCRPPPGQPLRNYRWDYNSYYGYPVFGVGTEIRNFAGWRTLSSLDAHSQQTTNFPSDVKVIIRGNKYDPKRAHIVVYNWPNRMSVRAEVKAFLARGDTFELRNAQDYFGPPVLLGTYVGEPLTLPLTNLTATAPKSGGRPRPTGPLFNTFVLQGRAAGRSGVGP